MGGASIYFLRSVVPDVSFPTMKKITLISLLTTALVAVFLSSCSPKEPPVTTGFPAGIDHGPWSALLAKYVDGRGLVDYKGLKANEEDLKKLDTYLAEFGKTEGAKAEGDEKVATATNAYNAFAIRTIISNYPTKSIRDIDKSFTQKTHDIGGVMLSLDDIEKGNVVPGLGADAHAIVVCCAKSCPPLQAEAYTKENLKSLTTKAATAWVTRKDLNDFTSEDDKIMISKIFDWYEADFEKEGGVKAWLKKFVADDVKEKIDKSKIDHLDYDWALNSQ